MSNQIRPLNAGSDTVRALAEQGTLRAQYERASADVRRRLRVEAFELVYPLVFRQLTRKIEARRGHHACMASIRSLEPDCLDRFHDDMDAVLDDLFHNARVPIHNLEGWVSKRVVAATVDGHRRRRGERGALQRPRIPRWLAVKLGNDKRLMDLAVDMLEWVGVEATAGLHAWPIEVWSARRQFQSADYEEASRSVERDIATVIAAMRLRPNWYADYVERPMGRKRLPLAGSGEVQPEYVLDPVLAAETAHAADDARRTELAALAVAAIQARLTRGEEARAVVTDVLSTAFGAGTGSDSLDRVPGQESADDERMAAQLADPATVDQIVRIVLDLLSP
ncbi:hypothetical protein Rhe02_39220 [Rhizocola hellebori]|uniref:Uncharacterized protein n=1 Tax=Rhizocola hellebori TaxID=1392758 RepID=A0A8J3QA47_9ACTN|nr:hypothetical protein [Rhizocola hellebori]GIH05855.1 hypothetical protein Rhe02_39220 [Rhizocola hellebori]